MKSPEVLITGVAGSGTTFVIRLFYHCGWDIGKPENLSGVSSTMSSMILQIRKGLEWIPLVIALANDEDVSRLDYPQVVKFPDMKPEKVRQINPGLVIITRREGKEDQNKYLYELIHTLERNQIGYVVVHYPKIALNAKDAWKEFQGPPEVFKALSEGVFESINKEAVVLDWMSTVTSKKWLQRQKMYKR